MDGTVEIAAAIVRLYARSEMVNRLVCIGPQVMDGTVDIAAAIVRLYARSEMHDRYNINIFMT